jgi:transposase, IS5 family
VSGDINRLNQLKSKILDRTAVVGVVGLGYVGLPFAVEKAKVGFKVIGKAHINIDRDYGFLSVATVLLMLQSMTPRRFMPDNLTDDIGVDSAYRSTSLEAVLEQLDYNSHIHERGYRNRPLKEAQKQSNRDKSKIRAAIEHVFGYWMMNMAGKAVRCVGLRAVSAYLGLKMLTFNKIQHSDA